jgi:NAD-reducing hydrogenase small subunit
MSFLDLDEWLFGLAANVDLVYSPLADVKVFPDEVDVTLAEGAVANEDNLELIRRARAASRTLVSFGDCAVTGNVTALRNRLGEPVEMLRRLYVEAVDASPGMPDERPVVPALLPKVLPVHHVVAVDLFLPGCPPPADRIRGLLQAILTGESPPSGPDHVRFG